MKYLTTMAITCIFMLTLFGINKVHSVHNTFEVQEHHSVICGAGFFYNVYEMDNTTFDAMEEASLQCSDKKQEQRGTQKAYIHQLDKVYGWFHTFIGHSTSSQDVYIDGMLIVNWEVSPAQHYNILKAYLED